MNGATWLLDAWVGDFAQVLEMMTAQSCRVSWSPAGSASPDANLWWKQGFSVAPNAPLFLGASAKAWSDLGAQALRAAGVDVFEQSEARNTYLELLQQSISSVATSLGAKVGATVEAGAGEVSDSPLPTGFVALVKVTIEELASELVIVVPGPLVEYLTGGPAPNVAAPLPTVPAGPPSNGAGPAAPGGMEFLLDVELPVSISFGHARLPLTDVLKLTTGSVVELDRQPEEHVDVIINNTVIARGEVVVVEGNYGVRISQIINRQNRLNLRAEERQAQQRS